MLQLCNFSRNYYSAPASICLACSSFILFSFKVAIFLNFAIVLPVPAGISLPTITFSFSPTRSSFLPAVAASVKTLVVSWKEAAEIKDFVVNLL